MPLLERARVEVYIPDPHITEYDKLLSSLEAEFTYAFGGCTIMRGLEGNYLSRVGNRTRDRINLIYSDVPLTLSLDSRSVAAYAEELRRVATNVLKEEVVLVAVAQIYHAV